MFGRGEKATVVRNDYVEPGERTFIGETGDVVGETETCVVVRFPGEARSYGFEPQEVKRSK